jgi:hypothetical protein
MCSQQVRSGHRSLGGALRLFKNSQSPVALGLFCPTIIRLSGFATAKRLLSGPPSVAPRNYGISFASKEIEKRFNELSFYLCGRRLSLGLHGELRSVTLQARCNLSIWELVNQNEENCFEQRFGTFIDTCF